MTLHGRWAALALACVLLAGCAAKQDTASASVPQNPAGPNVQTDWSVLTEETPLPAVGERWYETYTPELIPRTDYGSLLPFKGALGMTLSWWEEEPAYTSPSWFYGLMTRDGTLVMDAVCSSIGRCSYSQPDQDTGLRSEHTLPVYTLTKGDREQGRPGAGTLVALAAEDGSWWTGFQYWGAIAYPDGVAVGDQDGLTLIDAKTGAEQRQFSWAELGIDEPGSFPWFTGDATGTAQWADGRIYLGVYGDLADTALFLDPYTGAVSTSSAQDWFNQLDSYYNNQAFYWTSQTSADGTITLTRGNESHTFTSPLPQAEYPSVFGNDRVYFSVWEEQGSTFAVTDLEGKVLIPLQKGALTILDGTGEGGPLLFSIPSGGEWTIYNRDGQPLYDLPGGTNSWCYLNGSLIEITLDNCASYYLSDTGECIRRTYAGLEGRDCDL